MAAHPISSSRGSAACKLSWGSPVGPPPRPPHGICFPDHLATGEDSHVLPAPRPRERHSEGRRLLVKLHGDFTQRKSLDHFMRNCSPVSETTQAVRSSNCTERTVTRRLPRAHTLLGNGPGRGSFLRNM